MKNTTIWISIVCVGSVLMFFSCESELSYRKRTAKRLRNYTEGYLATKDTEALEKLETAAMNGSSFERMYALTEIQGIIIAKKQIPQSCKPVLLKAVVSEDPFVRREAAFAIEERSEEFLEAIPTLCEVIKKYPGWDASCTAAEALGKMGPTAKDAIPVLEDARKTADDFFRRSIDEALVKIKTPQPN